MSGKVHSVFGLLVGLNVLIILNQGEYIPLFVPIYILGALLPDIDLYNSSIGRILFPISYPINKMFGHRTITHSFLGLTLFNFLLHYFLTLNIYKTPLSDYVIFYIHLHFIIGYLTHLFSDMLTYSGVPLFYPFKRRFNLMKIPTKKIPDKLITSVLTVLIGITLVFQ